MGRIDRTQAVRDVNEGGFNPRQLLAILCSGVNPDGTSFTLPVEAAPRVSDWHLEGASQANAALVLTRPAEAGKLHVLTAIEVSFTAAPASSPRLVVAAPAGTTRVRRILSAQNPAPLAWPNPLGFAVGAELRIEVQAAGLSVITELSAHGFTI